ncbi:MAG: tRNA epoxyqueuosine(34) reductase QueG [Limnochordia bacterium]|jgi:epoxyqueuosine reductase|nr:tRNA epoxyqueuosine(34) reductase QueG [Bacillota bacterium]NLL08197.1 tRNA epoxyqueuosine(34) reductase QueG [Bacillota bacterium]HBG10285.1 tRNA epoxyqueuosine(34) reductase QueG [Bacillota bacterium]
MDRESLDALGKVIREAGFDAFAVMPARPSGQMLAILRQAQEEGRYPEFVDPDVEKRVDPRNLQQSAKAVIALAVSYNTGPPGPVPPLHGTISRSAWGLDYHRVLQERMEKLIRYLTEHHGARECSKAVDTSFLVDRALAVEAGLGFPGSNCAVYVPPFGSWVFLGAVLVDVELASMSHTGQGNWSCPVHCDLCIRACPTGALLAPGKIKPQRCLSYLTQMSGSIPLEFRSKLGSRLWGCDTCQQVCPVNKEAVLTRHEEFAPLVGPHVPLLPLLDLNKREFKEMFGRTSLSWRGKNILQRNACIVLGNQGIREALPALKKTAREHPSPMVKEAAAWAVSEMD